MAKKTQLSKKNLFKLYAQYGLHVWIILFIANVALLYGIHFYLIAQTCMTPQQVQSDSRCLYIMGNQIFEKGTKAAPHKGHPCGTDVTSVVPSSHINNQANYLTPNFIAQVCSATPTSAPTQAPTAAPTSAPTATDTPPVAPGVTYVLTPTNYCLGGCPTLTPIAPSQGVSQPSVSQPAGGNGGGGNNGGGNGGVGNGGNNGAPGNGGANGNANGGGFFGMLIALFLALIGALLHLLGFK